MTELAKKLDLSADITEKLERLLLNKSEMVNKYAEMCASSGFHHLRGKSGVFNLAVILKLACDVKSKYDYAGIDEKVYYDTMSDIKIWCDKTGGKGLENYGWLLFEDNKEFMAKDSNILKFMALFDIRYSIKIDKQAIERIFGKRSLFKKNYSEKTALQRSAKKYLLDGNKLGIGIGVIKA